MNINEVRIGQVWIDVQSGRVPHAIEHLTYATTDGNAVLRARGGEVNRAELRRVAGLTKLNWPADEIVIQYVARGCL